MGFDGRIGHLDGLESPFSNAGGVAKTVEELARLAYTGIAYAEDGSHVIEKGRKGNAYNPETGEYDRVVYHHDPVTGETHNSLGMPGPGIEAVEADAAERIDVLHGNGKKYVLNIAPLSKDPVSEVKELVTRGYEMGADAVIVNGGCPNVEEDGNNHPILSRNALMSRAVLSGLTEVTYKYQPVWYRISPQETFADLKAVAEGVIASRAVSAVLVPNTWPVDVPLKANGERLLDIDMPKCGLSGPVTLPDVLAQVIWWVHALKGTKIDVVASGGITNARALKQALDLKAVAGAGTTFFYESQRGWQEEVDRMLTELASQY
jgi:dihydroorotate dehydrogenase